VDRLEVVEIDLNNDTASDESGSESTKCGMIILSSK